MRVRHINKTVIDRIKGQYTVINTKNNYCTAGSKRLRLQSRAPPPKAQHHRSTTDASFSGATIHLFQQQHTPDPAQTQQVCAKPPQHHLDATVRFHWVPKCHCKCPNRVEARWLQRKNPRQLGTPSAPGPQGRTKLRGDTKSSSSRTKTQHTPKLHKDPLNTWVGDSKLEW